MPADRFLPQQEQTARQPGDIHPLPAEARQYATVNRQLQHLLDAMPGMQRGFKGIQRGGLADAVDTQSQAGHVAPGGGMPGEDHLQHIAERRNLGGNFI